MGKVSLRFDIFFLACIVIGAIKLTFGLENHLDIEMFDEVGYLVAGTSLLTEGLPDPEYGPLYTIWYFLLSLIEPDAIKLYFFNYKVLTVLLPSFLYILLRSYGAATLTSFWASSFFLISYINLYITPKVSHFSFLILMVVLILANRTKTRLREFEVLAIGTFIVALARPEFFLSFVIFFTFAAFSLIRGAGGERRYGKEIVIFSVALLGTLSLLFIFGIPVAGDSNRRWIAFGSMFAYNYVNWTGSALDPWVNWHSIVRENFGDANTITGVIKANPLMFLKHVVYNLFIYVKNLVSVLFAHYNIVIPSKSRLFTGIEALGLLTLIGGLIYRYRAKVKDNLAENIPRHLFTIIIYLILMLPTVLAVFLILPKYQYLVAQSGLIVVGAVILTTRLSSDNTTLKGALLSALVVLVLVPTVDSKAWYYNTGGYSQENVKTIRYIRGLELEREVRVLTATGLYGAFIGKDFKTIPQYVKTVSFNRLLKERSINMVIVNDDMLNDLRYSEDPEWHAFIKVPEALGFSILNVPHTGRRIYVKGGVLREGALVED